MFCTWCLMERRIMGMRRGLEPQLTHGSASCHLPISPAGSWSLSPVSIVPPHPSNLGPFFPALADCRQTSTQSITQLVSDSSVPSLYFLSRTWKQGRGGHKQWVIWMWDEAALILPRANSTTVSRGSVGREDWLLCPVRASHFNAALSPTNSVAGLVLEGKYMYILILRNKC